MKDTHPLVLGDVVTVGHGAILHGCTIESRVLIGMGAILLNGARIGEGSIVAAGTLVPEGTVVPPGSLFMGHPGKFRRALTPEDQASIEAYAARYVEYSETYKAEAGRLAAIWLQRRQFSDRRPVANEAHARRVLRSGTAMTGPYTERSESAAGWQPRATPEVRNPRLRCALKGEGSLFAFRRHERRCEPGICPDCHSDSDLGICEPFAMTLGVSMGFKLTENKISGY